MGSVFKKQTTRPVPGGAEFIVKSGERYARWRVRGKPRTARLTVGGDGTDRIVTESATYYAKFRDADGTVITRSTSCRDRMAAEQLLARWEREVEQVRAGVLDPKDLTSARRSSAPLADMLSAYDRSLAASEVSDTYRANVLRAVRRLARECRFASLADIDREAVEGWLATRAGEGMSARSRNYYRNSLVVFANWCRDSGRIREHDLDRLPRADERADPRRQRRALTADELTRLLAVAVERPLLEARTVRRGARKGEAYGDVRSEVAERLRTIGRERSLIYKTLVLTGLRVNELRTLTVGRLELTPGAECLRLEAKNEKNRTGSFLPIRADLAVDLRGWIADCGLTGPNRLFIVPAGLRLILDRDLKAAGIPKRDDRGRTVDVHALRTTFGTMLSTTGTAPRTAQAAMRHSDIKLTMGVYTDPRLLDVRGAVERLPSLTPTEPVTLPVTRPTGRTGQSGAMGDKNGPSGRSDCDPEEIDVSACCDNEKPPVTSSVTGGRLVGPAGFEPTTSCTPSKLHTVGYSGKHGSFAFQSFRLHPRLHQLGSCIDDGSVSF